MKNRSFAQTLLTWYTANARPLPWRATRDVYAIWLSEIILQQTRVEQGLDYWNRFIRRWPDVSTLAHASEDEVLREWQGLGYYSRARNLLTAARQVEEMGGFPTTAAGLKQLKGIGDYTAAAIASMAFDEDVSVVDGNVYRVLSRYYGIDTPIDTSEGKATFTALANELLPKGEASRFNQAMMDFGATQCLPRSPHCEQCPLAETCHAFRTHTIDKLPAKKRKTAVKPRHLVYYYIRCGSLVAIHRRPPHDIWQGLWEPFLASDSDNTDITPPRLHHPSVTLIAKDVRHQLTHRNITADFYLVEAQKADLARAVQTCLQTAERKAFMQRKPDLGPDYQWVEESMLDNYAKPRLIEKLIQRLGQRGEQP